MENINYGILSVIPPILTIILAFVTKNVFVSLFFGIFLGFGILNSWHFIAAFNDTLFSLIKVFENTDNTIVIAVVMLLGGLIYAIEKSGGIDGFVKMMTSKNSIIKSKKHANIFTWLLGIFIFISGTLSILVVGSMTKPINDAMKVPHEKSAFIVHTTSTPVCALLPLSNWGALMMSYLHSAGVNNADTAKMVLGSIPLNFYCIIAVFSVLFFSLTGKDFGPMKKAEQRAEKTGALDNPAYNLPATDTYTKVLNEGTPLARNILVPLGALIGIMLAVLFITGAGNPIKGYGMVAILWGTVLSLIVAGVLYVSQKTFSFEQYLSHVFAGSGEMFSIALILVLSFAMGGVVKQIGTGLYMATLFKAFLMPAFLPALVFVVAMLISFSTGTSLGTMAITVVIAIPMAVTLGVNQTLVAAAVFGGSVFGDHTSPISDTTIMSCSTTGCNVMDHVRSQLPYALCFAGITVVMYIIAGFVM